MRQTNWINPYLLGNLALVCVAASVQDDQGGRVQQTWDPLGLVASAL